MESELLAATEEPDCSLPANFSDLKESNNYFDNCNKYTTTVHNSNSKAGIHKVMPMITNKFSHSIDNILPQLHAMHLGIFGIRCCMWTPRGSSCIVVITAI